MKKKKIWCKKKLNEKKDQMQLDNTIEQLLFHF